MGQGKAKERKGREYRRVGPGRPGEAEESFQIKNRRQLVRNRVWAFAIDLRRISSNVPRLTQRFIPWEIS